MGQHPALILLRDRKAGGADGHACAAVGVSELSLQLSQNAWTGFGVLLASPNVPNNNTDQKERPFRGLCIGHRRHLTHAGRSLTPCACRRGRIQSTASLRAPIAMFRWLELSPTEPVLRLPHPYLTPYYLVQSKKEVAERRLYRIQQGSSSPAGLPHQALAGNNLSFTEPLDPKSSERPDDSNNSPWARARRTPHVVVLSEPDESEATPTLGQLWLAIYVIFTLRPGAECFRLDIEGEKSSLLKDQLKAVSLAVQHASENDKDDLVILRSTFWQGAGSPFGPRPPWVPDEHLHDMIRPISSYPANALDYVLTDEPGIALRWHPRRPAKPLPGSVIYSRYIPHLKENFSMVALDYQNSEHLRLFHTWQNDPRVSQGWNGTGSLEQHREYLRKAHEDPHQITVLARFDDTFFAYFDIYWAKVSSL